MVLVRGSGAGLELFWVRRSRGVALGGGFHAFPGGRMDDADLRIAQSHRLTASGQGGDSGQGADAVHGDSGAHAAAGIGAGRDGGGLDDVEAALRVAAIRELFEEVGVLLAPGSFEPAALDAHRRDLLDGRIGFEEVLTRLGARLDLSLLQPAGRWVTPPVEPVRFDARFYLAMLPAKQDASVLPGELVDGEWITPSRALSRWRRGRALLHPPALHVLRCMEQEPVPECLAAMRRPPHVVDHMPERIEFQAGFFLVPLLTPTLPPATHTNCFIVGDEELVVIDPPSPYPEEQARLAAFCRQLQKDGYRFREILLTHEHRDHIGGVEALRTELGIPVRAHPQTIERLPEDIRVDAAMEDGEVIRFPGPLGLRLCSVFTPGHARGHLCFFEETTGALIAGDMVAGVGTIVVDPPEGDMSDYIASLRKLRDLPVRTIYPAHGPAIPDGPAKLDEYLEHRAQRERQVYDALVAAGEGTAKSLVPRVYDDVPESIHALAARSLSAILDKLVKEKRVSVDTEGRYRPLE